MARYIQEDETTARGHENFGSEIHDLMTQHGFEKINDHTYKHKSLSSHVSFHQGGHWFHKKNPVLGIDQLELINKGQGYKSLKNHIQGYSPAEKRHE